MQDALRPDVTVISGAQSTACLKCKNELLIIVRRDGKLMNSLVARAADGDEVGRQFVEDAQIAQVMDLRSGGGLASFADAAGA